MKIFKNGEIHKGNGEIIFGDILVSGKRIEDIGEDLFYEGAEIIDLNGAYVAPGFIEAHSHLGLHGQGVGAPGNDVNELTNPITPEIRGVDGINPLDDGFKSARANGITTVMAGPGSANVICGTFALLKTYGDVIDNMLIEEECAMKAALGENPKRVYGGKGKCPSTRMGTAALLRETLYKAINYKAKKEAAIKKGEYFEKDFKLEALVRVINKEIPLKCHCHRADDIVTAIRIRNEFGIKMTLDHCTEGHLIKKYIGKNNIDVILGPTLSGKSKVELRDKGFFTAKELHEVGVRVALTTDYPVIPLEGLLNAAIEVSKLGVAQEECLKMITSNSAEIAGCIKRVGTIEIGKDCDLVIMDKNPFEYVSNILKTVIDGKIVFEKN